MAGKVKHRKVSAVADGGDTTLVRPQADWNDSLVLSEGESGNIPIRDAGSPDGWKFVNYVAGNFTNNTGVPLADGDVVAVDASGTVDESTGGQVVLGDTQGSLQQYVVAKSAPAHGARGLFAVRGPTPGVKAAGAIAAKEYVRKSATTKTVEGTGVSVGSAQGIPNGALGYALAPAAAGVVPVFLFGFTVGFDAGTIATGIVPTARLGSGTADATTALFGDSTWKKTGFEPESAVEIYEEFISAISFLADSFSSQYPWGLTAATSVTQQNVAGGVVRLDGSVTMGIWLAKLPVTALSLFLQSSKNPTIMARWASFGSDGPVGSFRRIGSADESLVANPANGMFFRREAGNNILAVCRSGAVESTLDTAVAPALGTFVKGKLAVTGGGTNVAVFIDGVSKGNLTTNIPAAVLGLSAGQNALAGGSGIDLDYLHLKQDR